MIYTPATNNVCEFFIWVLFSANIDEITCNLFSLAISSFDLNLLTALKITVEVPQGLSAWMKEKVQSVCCSVCITFRLQDYYTLILQLKFGIYVNLSLNLIPI